MAGLLSLIGNMVGVHTPQPPQDDTITVTAARNQDKGQAPLQALVPNPKLATQQQLDAAQPLANLPEHKGRLFGAKGTLRDVLGTLGDAFLVQSGNKAVYGPQRHQEQVSDALTGYSDNPLDAIKRLNAIDPEYAQQLYQNWQTNNIAFDKIDATKAAAAAAAGNHKATVINQFGTRLGQMLNGAKTPQQRAAIMAIAGKQASSMGISLDDLGVGEDDLTPEEQAAFVNGATTVNQQNNLPIAQQNADTRRISATKPPAPKNPPRRGYTDVEAEAFDTPADKRTPEQQAIIKARLERGRGRGSGRSSGNRSSVSAPPSTSGWTVTRH